jgi:hypothetical protein
MSSNPSAKVKHHHAPWFAHQAAELAPRSDRLAERSDIGDEQGEDGGPVTAQDAAQFAVRHADEDDDVGDAIRQFVDNLAGAAGLARR